VNRTPATTGGLVPITTADGSVAWQSWEYNDLLLHLNNDLLLDTSTIPALVNGPWINAFYQNAWGTTGGSQPAQFMKDALGFVHLRGRITGGATGSVAFTLPVGYRSGDINTLMPAGAFNGVTASGAFLNTGIAAAGGISVWFPAGFGDVGFTGLSFLAEM